MSCVEKGADSHSGAGLRWPRSLPEIHPHVNIQPLARQYFPIAFHPTSAVQRGGGVYVAFLYDIIVQSNIGNGFNTRIDILN